MSRVIHVLYRKPYRISRSCVSTAGMKVVTRVITSSFTKDGVFYIPKLLIAIEHRQAVFAFPDCEPREKKGA